MNRTRALCLAACLILVTGNAAAHTITVSFTGTITTTGGLPGSAPFGVGDSVSGTIVYERSGAVDTIPGDPTDAEYSLATVQSFDITLNGVYTMTADLVTGPDFDNYIRVRDELGGTFDGFAIRAEASGAAIGTNAVDIIQFDLGTTLGDQLSGDDLPLAGELSNFSASDSSTLTNFANFCCDTGGAHEVEWQLDAFTAVPEPAGAAFALSMLACLGLRRSRPPR